MCYLKIFILLIVLVAGLVNAKAAKCHMENDVSYEGNTIGEFGANSADICQEFCDSVLFSKCTFWTFNTEQNVCMFKSSNQGKTTADGSISGSRCKGLHYSYYSQLCSDYSREECLGKGESGDTRTRYKGQPCVIPREGTFKFNSETTSQNQCEPIEWVLKNDKENMGDCDSGPEYHMEIGVDYKGNNIADDLKYVDSVVYSAADCQKLCDGKYQRECKFWTYNIADKQCFLKYAKSGHTKSLETISGSRCTTDSFGKIDDWACRNYNKWQPHVVSSQQPLSFKLQRTSNQKVKNAAPKNHQLNKPDIKKSRLETTDEIEEKDEEIKKHKELLEKQRDKHKKLVKEKDETIQKQKELLEKQRDEHKKLVKEKDETIQKQKELLKKQKDEHEQKVNYDLNQKLLDIQKGIEKLEQKNTDENISLMQLNITHQDLQTTQMGKLEKFQKENEERLKQIHEQTQQLIQNDKADNSKLDSINEKYKSDLDKIEAVMQNQIIANQNLMKDYEYKENQLLKKKEEEKNDIIKQKDAEKEDMKKEKETEKENMKKEKDVEKENIIKQRDSAFLVYQISVGIVGLTFLILFFVFGTWCCIWNKNDNERQISEEQNEEVHITNPASQDENTRKECFEPSMVQEEMSTITTNDSFSDYDTIDREFSTMKTILKTYQKTYEHNEMLPPLATIVPNINKQQV